MKEPIHTTGRISQFNHRRGQVIIKVFVDDRQRHDLSKIMGEELNITLSRAQLELFEEESHDPGSEPGDEGSDRGDNG